MPQCCVVYTTDDRYLFPTLVSAIQARHHTSPGAADVVIYCIDLSSEAERVFAPLCAKENLGLVSVNSKDVEGQNAMLARFFLNRFVPAQYSQYLYLDGDVHIFDALDPLIEAGVPEGHFLAANDPMTFLIPDPGAQSRDLSSHLEKLGLSRQQALCYFNSGVLRIHSNGWETIGLKAWEHCRRTGKPSRFPDQDALNVVAADKRLPMSLAWNFPVFMRNSRVESSIKPKITHFMSNPKPWHGSFPPWTPVAYKPYADALNKYPALEPFSTVMPLRRRAAYQFQQHGKKIFESLTWGFSEKRVRILSYEASCPL